MGEGIATKPKIRGRRIIERPRLTRLLDESQGRIKMLVAPAGYGKTTLARQWLEGKRAVWYTATPASVDVAALAAGLQATLATVCAGAGDALVARLPVTARTEDEPDVLGGMLASDLQAWPSEAWLAIDDYHAFGGTRGEQLVETLLMQAPLNVLVMSRRRPVWASSRRILYGEIFELDRSALAMTNHEADKLLASQSREAADLVELARGWPAILGLAAVSTAQPPDMTAAPHVYRFFAEEIYQRIDRRSRHLLCELALYETGGRALALRELPPDVAERVLRVGSDNGFLTDAGDGTFEMHPLLRGFLERKLTSERGKSVAGLARRATRLLIDNDLWDEAYRLISRFETPEMLPELLSASMDALLASGRTSTLRTWTDAAPEHAPSARLAGAELSFREGRFHESESLATLAAEEYAESDALRARCLLTAGRAAHAASREERAGDLYAEATRIAPTSELKRVAAFGELSAAIELERAEAPALLRDLGPTNALEADDRVILVSRMINLETRFGLPVSVEEGRAMWQLLNRVKDPVARSSFRNVFGYALAAMGHFDEALELMTEQLEDADSSRLDFVVPYTLTNQAIVGVGRRDYLGAEALLDEAEERALRSGDQTAHYIAWAVRTRLYNAQAAFDLALARPLARDSGLTRSLEGELMACYAIALAGQGELERALDYATRAEGSSRAVEVAISTPCARAIVSARTGAPADALEHARSALLAATHSGMIESFVCAYRGFPELIIRLMEDTTLYDDLERVLMTVGDEPLAGARDIATPSIRSLSRREKEVLSLVGQGLSNHEIGARLFICTVTVKVHVRHIFEKLGVKSRTEAALRAAQIQRN